MNKKISQYKNLFIHKPFLSSLGISILLFLLSMIVNFKAGTYATISASNSVTDIILSNIRVYDVDNFFIYGSFIFALFTVLITLYKPERIPFVIKSVALFILIRSLFITLTHLGPFPSQLIIDSNLLSKMSFGGDLFFSGHTGLPFLLSLIFWNDKYVRYIFLGFSFMFAIVVLLGHLHYSIDVLAAFFISYTIFHITLYLFKKDRKMFHYFDNI
jgi:membrane-associated phospholipid phosphatase